MSYIQELRKKIGHQVIMCPACSVIIVDKQGKLLIEHRADDHMYSNIGGSMEIDEACEETAAREMEEETGLKPLHLDFFKVYSGKLFHHYYPNGDEVSYVDVVFICNKYTGTLTPQKEEVSDLKFYAPEDLPSDLLDTSKQLYSDYLKMKGIKVPSQLKYKKD